MKLLFSMKGYDSEDSMETCKKNTKGLLIIFKLSCMRSAYILNLFINKYAVSLVSSLNKGCFRNSL